MVEAKRIRPQLEDVTPLFHCIQSLLPVKEAARTCVLSKSWLHAWSTIPTLRFRFHKPSEFYKTSTSVFEEQKTEHINLIDRTMLKYHQHNIPIETFDLELRINNQESASLANKWIQTVATQRRLKKLSLKLYNKSGPTFILPDEIFSGENLYSIVISGVRWACPRVCVTRNSLIKCASLRVLELEYVKISEEVLDNLFSTCTLLEKINLSHFGRFPKIKVENLRHLHKLTINNASDFLLMHDYSSINSVINYVALKVLELISVNISGEVLDNLLSTCTLLEKIQLSVCKDLTKIKVKNLRYLQELILEFGTREEYEILEVDDVPNLRIFRYGAFYSDRTMLNIDSDLLRRVTELNLHDGTLDVALIDMINSKLPFLESLDLGFNSLSMKKLDIKSMSLKKLKLRLSSENRQIDVQVYSPKLLNLFYDGPTIPNLVFPNHTVPEEIKLRLLLFKPMHISFVYKMREVLSLSSKFDIGIVDYGHQDPDVPLDIDIDNLKKRFQIPATNVHKLVFDHHAWSRKCLVQPSCFDELFTICHPNYIEIVSRSEDHCSSLFKLMKSGLEKNKMLKSIEFKNPCNKKWEILLTDSCTRIFDTCCDDFSKEDWYYIELKLNWRSL